MGRGSGLALRAAVARAALLQARAWKTGEAVHAAALHELATRDQPPPPDIRHLLRELPLGETTWISTWSLMTISLSLNVTAGRLGHAGDGVHQWGVVRDQFQSGSWYWMDQHRVAFLPDAWQIAQTRQLPQVCIGNPFFFPLVANDL